MKILNRIFEQIGKAFTSDLKEGAETSLEHAQRSLDRVSWIAGAAVVLALILGLLALYFGFFRYRHAARHIRARRKKLKKMSPK